MGSLRWVVFSLGVSTFWLSFFHRFAPAAIAGDLTAAFDVSGAALGALAATYFAIYALMQLPTGVLADTLGPRKVLTAGSFITGTGSLLFAAAESVATAAIGRTLVGLGVSVAFICMLKLNANWFEDRRFATATGWTNLVGITGALAATAPLAWLVTVMSWRTVFTAVGLVSLALAVLIAWKVQDSPRDLMRAAQPAPETRWYRGLAAVLRNRATWPGFWVNFGLSGTNMSFVGLWAVPYLTHTYGMSPLVASRHTSLIVAGYACSTALAGWLSDRTQRRRPIIVFSCVMYLACWAAWLVGVPAGWTYFLAAFMGAMVGGFSLAWACAKEVNAPPYAGMATSVANAGGFIAAGILQPLVGWVLDVTSGPGGSATGNFQAALGVLALFTAIGLAGAVFIRETRCRNIWPTIERVNAKKGERVNGAKPTVLVTREVFDETLAYLSEHCDVDSNQGDVALAPDVLEKRLVDKDGVLCSLTDRIDAGLLEHASKLKVVANIAVGYNNIDVAACSARGIMATNTPGVLDDSTADMAWTLILGAARRVTEVERYVRNGGWTGWRLKQWMGIDVHHATLGIIGMGRIGRAIARRAAGFEMRVLYHNRKRVGQDIEQKLNASWVSLDELLRQSDFVVLQVPYSPETHHLIGAAQLAMMKPSAIIVNSTRGGVIDDAALIAALQAGTIRAAGLDVYENEPSLNPGFLALENVVLVPHVGSSTEATRRAMAMTAAKNAVAALTGGVPPNLLNPDARKS